MSILIVGMVGMIEVSVSTGAMSNTPKLKADIERQAMALAKKHPLSSLTRRCLRSTLRLMCPRLPG